MYRQFSGPPTIPTYRNTPVLIYGTGDEGLQGWTDADVMVDARKTRSKTGLVFTMCGGAITWHSCLQPTITRITCEVEHMEERAGCRESLAQEGTSGHWSRNLFSHCITW